MGLIQRPDVSGTTIPTTQADGHTHAMARLRNRGPAGVLSSNAADDGYKAPWRWRLAGVAQLPIFVLATVSMMLEYPATWKWIAPLSAEAVMVCAMIQLNRARTKRAASIATLIQSILAIAALFLLPIVP